MPTKKKSRGVLSVDLAHKRYTDNGIAYLESGTDDIQIIKADDLGLSDTPSPSDFASFLTIFCEKKGDRSYCLMVHRDGDIPIRRLSTCVYVGGC